jgi:eukaryotic-like serine/threonine-protein kinase
MPETSSHDDEVTLSVLLVDDEPAVRRAIARLLRAKGHTVVECESGEAAVELVGTRPFDVVLSDIDMPGLSGIELLGLLRQRQIPIPVVLMTGAPTIDTAVKAVEHGAFKYLMKPVDPDALLETVDRAARSPGRSADSSQQIRGAEPSRSMRALLAPGAVLADRYRLVRLLGEGGMGQVWEAVQLSTARSVAVKLLHASLNSRARSEMTKRMLREARAASSVEHPNVVDVFDVFELGDGTPVLVMALLRGRTLGHRLAQGAQGRGLSLADAAQLLLPVASAVGTAHANGVVHRDLKPDNIFLAEEGGRTTVKVLDFGIAKLVSNEHEGGTLTAAGTPIGTPGYMAPEQAMGERDVDHRADVWSLGAILYEALSGIRPVQADSVGQTIRKLFMDVIVPLVEHAPDLPLTVTKLVDRMLARERDLRPGDLREVASELARYTDVAVPAFGPPAPGKTARVQGGPAANDALAHARTEVGEGEPPKPSG